MRMLIARSGPPWPHYGPPYAHANRACCVRRWGNLPITEARTFGHQKVVEYLEHWEATHQEQPQDAEGASEPSVPLPQ
jgi:hypothetical protein